MKISWGIKIALLYLGFVLLIGTMVVASTRQHFDLVSDKYYADEIVYQDVIDAGKNQSSLSQPVLLHANETAVTLDLPTDLKDKAVSGDIYFYSAVHASWDKHFPANAINNTIVLTRSQLQKTHYTVKISIQAAGKKYYQESELDLGKQ